MKSNFKIFRFLPLVACATGILVLAGVSKVAAGETDQYLTWGTTFSDSSAELNAFLDEEIHRFLVKANRRTRPPACVEDLSIDLYLHLFEGLHASRIRNWLKTSPGVDRFPSDELSDWEYQRISIFRRPAFPFVLPSAQTIRVGEVYLGIDKIGHMFGFGRRYFQIYQRALEEGDSPEAALERVLTWGIQHESSLVGKLVDGIFSHGDMEANYQGLRLALAFSSGEAPLFYRENGAWRYRGGPRHSGLHHTGDGRVLQSQCVCPLARPPSESHSGCALQERRAAVALHHLSREFPAQPFEILR